MGNRRGSQTGGQKPKKRGYSQGILLEENRAKAAVNGSSRRAKRQPAIEKAPQLKKGKMLTPGSKLAIAEGGGVDGDEVVDE